MVDTFGAAYTFNDTFIYQYTQNMEQWEVTGSWNFPFRPNSLANDLFVSLMNSQYGRDLYAQHGMVKTIAVWIVPSEQIVREVEI